MATQNMFHFTMFGKKNSIVSKVHKACHYSMCTGKLHLIHFSLLVIFFLNLLLLILLCKLYCNLFLKFPCHIQQMRFLSCLQGLTVLYYSVCGTQQRVSSLFTKNCVLSVRDRPWQGTFTFGTLAIAGLMLINLADCLKQFKYILMAQF